MASNSKKAVKISQKNLLGIQDLSVSDVKLILSEAQKFIKLNRSKTKKLDLLNVDGNFNIKSLLLFEKVGLILCISKLNLKSAYFHLKFDILDIQKLLFLSAKL